jgi:peptide/nickel transport system permease protein
MSTVARGVPGVSAGVVPQRSARRDALRRLLRSPLFLTGSLILLWWVCTALTGQLWSPFSPYAPNLAQANHAPSAAHWFGTDQLGRDMFSRVMLGSRDILIVAPAATLLGTVIGTTLGLVTGYFRGVTDLVLSRVVEAMIALPSIVLGVVGIVALGRADVTVIIVIAIVFAPLVARTVRAAVLSECQLEYVAAARLRDEGALYIMVAEVLPNVMPTIIVEFTVRLGYAVFTIATLSFLGFGIQPPSPDWGLDVATNYGVVTAGYWWEVLFDSLAIASLVIGVNLIADAVESVLAE